MGSLILISLIQSNLGSANWPREHRFVRVTCTVCTFVSVIFLVWYSHLHLWIIHHSVNSSPPSAAYMRQWIGPAIIWTNAENFLIGPLGTNFSEILMEMITISFKKIRLKVSSAKRRPFRLGLIVLIPAQSLYSVDSHLTVKVCQIWLFVHRKKVIPMIRNLRKAARQID